MEKPAIPTPFDFSKSQLVEAAFLNLSIKSGELPAEPENRKIASFSSKVAHKKSFSIANNAVKIELEISCSGLDKTGKPTGIEGYFQIGFTFKVDDLAEHAIQIPGIDEKVPSPEIVVPLLGTAYSTARGMIMVKTSATFLEGFALPIVNARSLLQPVQKAEGKKKIIKKST